MRRALVTVILTTCLAFASAGLATAAPVETTSTPTVDTATARALELESKIEESRAESISIEERMFVTNIRIFQQQETLAAAREHLAAARERYQERVVRIYKSNTLNPLTILLSSESVSDFYARALMLSRIAERDHQSFSDASLAAAEAEYQAAVLDDLKAQDLALRQIQDVTRRTLEDALVEQRQLVVQLSAAAKKALEAARAANRTTREQWQSSSIPVGSSIPLKTAVVQPYADRSYLVPEYQPSTYRSLNRTMNAVCSWYGNEFNGRRTASGQIFNQDDFTCASKTLPFGTRLAITRGQKRIVVVVNDRGPFIAGRDLDLSRGAARALGFSGVATVEAEFVEATR